MKGTIFVRDGNVCVSWLKDGCSSDLVLPFSQLYSFQHELCCITLQKAEKVNMRAAFMFKLKHIERTYRKKSSEQIILTWNLQLTKYQTIVSENKKTSNMVHPKNLLEVSWEYLKLGKAIAKYSNPQTHSCLYCILPCIAHSSWFKWTILIHLFNSATLKCTQLSFINPITFGNLNELNSVYSECNTTES